MKLAGDPNATKEPGDDASLEELKRIVEFHLERIAPLLEWTNQRCRRVQAYNKLIKKAGKVSAHMRAWAALMLRADQRTERRRFPPPWIAALYNVLNTTDGAKTSILQPDRFPI